jgi:Domain of unknown function (DUF4279)
MGDALEPAEITLALGTPPTTAYRKGEVYRRSRDGSKAARGRIGLWLLSTREHVEGTDLNRHLSYLLGVLFPTGDEEKLGRLRTLIKARGITADVACFWYGKAGAQPPIISKQLRDAFARLPARIETDFDTD